MRSPHKALTVAALAAALMAAPAAFAGAGESMDADKFVKQCDSDKDGMVSKSELMKMVEKTFEKADKKRMGKLDKAQVDWFLKELMKSGG
jgi:hypothetical protein